MLCVMPSHLIVDQLPHCLYRQGGLLKLELGSQLVVDLLCWLPWREVVEDAVLQRLLGCKALQGVKLQ